MLDNLKFRTKLMGSFGIVFILLAVVMGVYQYLVASTIAGFEELLQTEIDIADHAAQVEAFMLQCRRDEKDFLLRKDLRYIEQRRNHVKLLIQEAREIIRLEEQSGHFEDVKNAASIVGYAETYAENFEALVTSWEARGLDHNSGLQGQFRDIVHEVMDDLGQHEVEEVYLALLQMRRYEKDYLRTNSSSDKQKFLASIELYQEQLGSHMSEAGEKKAMEAALEKYLEARDALLANGSETSSLSREKRYEQMRAAAHEMEETLIQIYVPNIGALVLQIRRDEKDYLLRGKQTYVEATHTAVSHKGPGGVYTIPGRASAS